MPDGVTTAAHKQQAALGFANVLLDQFQEPGLHVNHSMSVLCLRGLDLTVVHTPPDMNLIPVPVNVGDFDVIQFTGALPVSLASV